MGARPTALGCHVFAGGFTAGMKEHLDVLAHLEASNYGVATTRRNHPGLEVRVSKDPAGWRAEDFRGRVDVVYGNPPCAPWSSAGVKVGAPKRDYAAGYDPRDPRVAWFRSAFGLLDIVRPRVLVLESVVRCWTAGRPFVDEHIRAAAALGYGTDVILLNGLDCGVPQHRRRVFLVFTKLAIAWARPGEPGPKTVRAALAGLVDSAPVIQPCTETELACVKITPPGGHLKDAYAKLYGDTRIGEHRPGQYGGRMSFLEVRLDPDRPSRTWLGGPRFYHPTEDRRVSVREAATLCGYPADYEFIGNRGEQYKQIAQAVMPPVGRWLGRQLAAAISTARPRDDLRTRVYDWLTSGAAPYEEDLDMTMTTMKSSGATLAPDTLQWPAIGDEVDYHAVIGGPVTHPNAVVREAPMQLAGGQWVVFLEGVSGCVALEACTPPLPPVADDPPDPLADIVAARAWLAMRTGDPQATTCLCALDVYEAAARRFIGAADAPAEALITPPAPPKKCAPAQHEAPSAPKGRASAPSPDLPAADPAVVARFTPRDASGAIKLRAAAELIRAMVMTGEFTDAEVAATAKAVYPDLNGPVHKYPGETRYRLKRQGLNPPPPRGA